MSDRVRDGWVTVLGVVAFFVVPLGAGFIGMVP